MSFLHPFCGWRHLATSRESKAHLGQSRKMLHGWKEDSMLIKRMYPSIFYRLRVIARYWSEIATFSYPLAFNAPVGVFPLEFWEKFSPQKTRIMGLPGSEDSLTIGWAVSKQYQRVSDGQTDGRTDVLPIAIMCTSCAVWLTHVKNLNTTQWIPQKHIQ